MVDPFVRQPIERSAHVTIESDLPVAHFRSLPAARRPFCCRQGVRRVSDCPATKLQKTSRPQDGPQIDSVP
jgi:hypothetical protein